jgi:thioesterase domain-containing protein
MTDLAAETEVMHQLIPILGHMGITIVDAGPGHATVELPAGPNGNHFGVLYAGSLFTACEVLGGLVPRASFDLEGELAGYVPLVKTAKINYLRPGVGDVRARGTISPDEIERVRAEALETGKSNFVMETEIVDGQGTVIATMRATNQLRKMA